MQSEYLHAREKGWLNKDYFCERDWSQLNMLMDDFDLFMESFGRDSM